MESDFPNSPPKRRRTSSPEPPVSDADMSAQNEPLSVERVPTVDPAVKEEIERKVAAENNFLDVLMQQVEAETTPHAPTTSTAGPTDNDASTPAPATHTTHGPDPGHTSQAAGEDLPTLPNAQTQEAAADTTMAETTTQQPPAEREWETDSSPYQSSDSDTSSDDSSSEDESDEDADGDYAMMDPEEAARILMQDDGGSDDEGTSKNNAGAGLRTAHERPEEIIPKPNITITEDMKIEELGNIEFIVENTTVIKAKTSGEYQVLESGSLLCLKDRSVIGVVAETMGRVEEPMYTVRFTNDEAIKEAGVSEKGTTIYYVPSHSTCVFTQPLKGMKGSDASNFHDEEVGDEEMEFSDDEKEAEHKRQIKLRKQGRKDDGGRGGRGRGRGRGGPHGSGRLSSLPESNGDVRTLDYDDDGEGYTPLARPANLHEMMNGAEPGEIPDSTAAPSYNSNNRRERGRGGRGGFNRGGGRGGRGNERNRVGYHQQSHHSQHNNTYSQLPLPPPPQQQLQQQQPCPFPPNQYAPYPGSTPSAPQLAPQPTNTNTFPNLPFSPSPISPLPGTNAGGGAFTFPQMPFPNFPGSSTGMPFPPPPPPPPPPGTAGFGFGGTQQQQQQQGINQAAFQQVQRQLEEMQRMAQQQQQGYGQGGQR